MSQTARRPSCGTGCSSSAGSRGASPRIARRTGRHTCSFQTRRVRSLGIRALTATSRLGVCVRGGSTAHASLCNVRSSRDGGWAAICCRRPFCPPSDRCSPRRRCNLRVHVLSSGILVPARTASRARTHQNMEAPDTHAHFVALAGQAGVDLSQPQRLRRQRVPAPSQSRTAGTRACPPRPRVRHMWPSPAQARTRSAAAATRSLRSCPTSGRDAAPAATPQKLRLRACGTRGNGSRYASRSLLATRPGRCMRGTRSIRGVALPPPGRGAQGLRPAQTWRKLELVVGACGQGRGLGRPRSQINTVYSCSGAWHLKMGVKRRLRAACACLGIAAAHAFLAHCPSSLRRVSSGAPVALARLPHSRLAAAVPCVRRQCVSARHAVDKDKETTQEDGADADAWPPPEDLYFGTVVSDSGDVALLYSLVTHSYHYPRAPPSKRLRVWC